MSVDPNDDCTFWYTNEYYTSTGSNWQTRIGAFRFSTCDPNGLVKTESNSALSSGIGAAYAALTGPDSLDIQSIVFYESLDLSGSFDVNLKGGFDSSFATNAGFSAIHGTVTIAGTGIITIDKLSVQ